MREPNIGTRPGGKRQPAHIHYWVTIDEVEDAYRCQYCGEVWSLRNCRVITHGDCDAVEAARQRAMDEWTWPNRKEAS